MARVKRRARKQVGGLGVGRKTTIGDMPPNMALKIARQLNGRNLAALRTAGRSTRAFGKEAGTCRSWEAGDGMRVEGTAITSRGGLMGFLVTIDPAVRIGRDTLDFLLAFTMYSTSEGPLTYLGSGTIETNRIVYRWDRVGAAPERYVRDQIAGCVSRECNRRAALLVQAYTRMLDSMIMETSPRTVAQMRTATLHTVQHGV